MVFGLEVAILIGTVIGIDVPFILATIFLPFVWLLLESVKPVESRQAGSALPRRELAEGHA